MRDLLAKNGITPQQAIQNLLNSGKLKQEDYNMIYGIASQFAGNNH